MKFRAVVLGIIEDGKNPQSFANNEAVIRKWAQQMYEKYESEVLIYERRELLIGKLNAGSEPAAVATIRAAN